MPFNCLNGDRLKHWTLVPKTSFISLEKRKCLTNNSYFLLTWICFEVPSPFLIHKVSYKMRVHYMGGRYTQFQGESFSLNFPDFDRSVIRYLKIWRKGPWIVNCIMTFVLKLGYFDNWCSFHIQIKIFFSLTPPPSNYWRRNILSDLKKI